MKGVVDEVQIIISLIALCLIFTIPAWFFLTAPVDAGNVGVLTTFGYIEPYPLQAGFHFKSPFSALHQMSIRTQSYTMSIASEESTAKKGDDTISTLTKEGLSIDLDITILYHLEPEKAVDVYKNVGQNYAEVIVRPQARSVLRNVIATFSASEIYSSERVSIEQRIYTELKNMTEPRGIVIEAVLLRNVKLPEQLNNAIQLKLSAQQMIQQKQFQVETQKLEAERMRQEAKGIADANLIISSSLTENYLRWYWVKEISQSNQTYYIPIGNDGLPLFKQV